MAELVVVAGAPHAPLIARDWDLLPVATQHTLTAAYRELGRRIDAARPDVLIVVAPDHWTNFFLDNLPGLCIGVGAAHEPPAEPFMRAFPYELYGDPALAGHLARSAYAEGFEPAISHRLRLDHGFTLPLWKMALERFPRIVPIALNAIEPPMPAPARCAAWGRLIAAAIASYDAPLRVGLLASGGLSHSIGEPTMGAIDADFDRRLLAAFEAADPAGLLRLAEAELPTQGNGTHEVRAWLLADAAAGSAGLEFVTYADIAEVYVGCGFAAWNLP